MITHPFHPLRGQSLAVIKTQEITGIESLILRGPLAGSLPVPREWTDWADPCPYLALGLPAPVLDATNLLALAEMLAHIAPEPEKGA